MSSELANGGAMALCAAAYDGNLKEVKALVEGRGIKADVTDPYQGSTALHWACFGGQLEVAKWLVKKAGSSVNYKNKENRTALLFACERCHLKVAQFLVKEGHAEVNEADKECGHTPLHRACVAGQARGEVRTRQGGRLAAVVHYSRFVHGCHFVVGMDC
ncbi:unnamed protein product [Choristocarpus tenellus]